ncbi:MAG TPA: hypothetical protein VNQ79_24910 [Blastocatellia bacterium]|nr:hypothetical protein [Blastocatellia bacterium]
MVHDNTQSLEEKLQQQVSSLLAKRFSSVEGEVQRLQASINEFCERLLTCASNREVATDEVADLHTELRQTLSEESDRASSRAVAEAVAKAEEEFQRKLTEAQAEAEAQISELRAELAASQQAALAAPAAEVAVAPQRGFDLVRQAVVELDAQRTQAEALTTLVRYAARFAPRVVFFVLKGGSAIGWKASGFANGLNDETARSLNVPVSSVTLLREAVERQQPVTASAEMLNEPLLGSYGAPQPKHAVAIPLTVRNKAAAILYADSETEDQAAINTDALATLLHVTSLVVELLPVRRSAEPVRPVTPQPQVQPVAAQPPAAPQPAPAVTATPAPVQSAPVFYGGLGDEQPARIETPAPGEQAAPAFASAVPTTQMPPVITAAPAAPESPVSLAPAPQPVEEPTPTPVFTAVPEPAPVPAAVPEPVTAAATTPLSSGAGQTQRSGSILPGTASESEVRAHNDARRFARLLVSEIKLYNEAKVSDGRRSHDLYERLKEDIDRSRQMYEKRVPPAVAAKYDYFYDELLHTLAEGDPSKLGHGCPGPTVPIN